MPVFTYDSEADALYVLLVDEEKAAIDRTEELSPTLHVDLNPHGRVVGVEFLHPRTEGLPTAPVLERFGVELHIPFSFAA